MTNIINFPAPSRVQQVLTRARQLADLRDKRVGDSITFADGKVVHITGERHKLDGSRDLLIYGMGDKTWVPDTAHIASPEHFA